jgi:hypothetical protein
MADLTAPTERDERFEVSTLKLVLQKLGKEKAEINALYAQLEGGFDWNWFNSEDLAGPTFGSARDFKFNFEALFKKPTIKHEIVKAVYDFRAELGSEVIDYVFIFNVHEIGRVCATNLEEEFTHIHVHTPEITFNVVKFNDLMEYLNG